MTYSRPTIDRLISTVDSGLQHGELGPYAQALRECLEEIEHATAHDGDHLSKASRHFCDTILNDRDAWRRKAEVALKLFSDAQGDVDAMRPVVEAAEAWRDAETDDEDALLMSGLMCAIDAYLASKATP